MSEENECPIWGVRCKEVNVVHDTKDHHVQSSRAGGRYIIATNALRVVQEWNNLEKAKLSRWIYKQNQLGNTPKIVSAVVQQVPNWPMPSVSERIDYLLQFAESKTRGAIGNSVQRSNEMLVTTVSSNPQELFYLIQQADEMGLLRILKLQSSVGGCGGIKQITIDGYQRLEELKRAQPNSDQAFVAMWFDETMNDAWENGFEPAIVDAGYKPLRIDRKEHINKIDDEIIAEIRRSRFVVADFTSEKENPRGGVYYEAGFAHGLNIPVIYTCREDCLGDVHFDTRQFNHLTWNAPDDLRKDLAKRISAVLGDGPHRARKQR